MADDTIDSRVPNFSDLGLNKWLVNQLKAVGLEKPTPIQQHCVPQILKGKDCLGCAKTGSGKTAAFALPILQKLCEDPFGIFALIITPTRELAYQICEQFNVLGQPIGLKACVITGGRDMIQQGLELAERPHIVITTPGRLADHIDTGTNFSLKKIKFLVLDEADKLLEDDFGEQLQTIFKVIPKKRQTLLFSATVTDTLTDLNESSENKPFCWMSDSAVATVEELDQRYVLMPADVKDAYMVHIIDKFLEENKSSSIIIFTSTCKYCQIIGMILKAMGFQCVVLNSMIPQRYRLSALAQFKSHTVKILIATDVASRGLDIPTVDLIINHNIPNRPKDYIHRVGRTARAGRGGMAISLVTQFDVKLIHAVEGRINAKLTEHETNEKEVTKIFTEVAVSRREAEIKLDERDFDEKKNIYKRKKLIAEGKDPDEEEKKKAKLIKKRLKEKKDKKYKPKKKTKT